MNDELHELECRLLDLEFAALRNMRKESELQAARLVLRKFPNILQREGNKFFMRLPNGKRSILPADLGRWPAGLLTIKELKRL